MASIASRRPGGRGGRAAASCWRRITNGGERSLPRTRRNFHPSSIDRPVRSRRDDDGGIASPAAASYFSFACARASASASASVLLRRGSSSSRRTFAVYASGRAWTGALGLGRDAMTDGILSEGLSPSPSSSDGDGEEEREHFVEVTYANPNDGDEECGGAGARRVTACAAGWGHTALIVEEEMPESSVTKSAEKATKGSAAAADDTQPTRTKLLVAGRPQDFQNLLRLNRLPAFVRRAIVRNSLRYDDGSASSSAAASDLSASGSFFGSAASRMIDSFLTSGSGEREAMVREGKVPGETGEEGGGGEFRYGYGILPSLTEVALPAGDEPAVASRAEGGGGCVLAASAGLTAVVGRRDGTLYAFGLNHRGQCGVGDDKANNVWDPAPVMGLGPFDLAEGLDGKGRRRRPQDRPIVSVSLGLQHGLALDDAGNLYSWGKGKRGQLGAWAPSAGGLRGGDEEIVPDVEYAALAVEDFSLPCSGERQRLSPSDSRVLRASAGMNRSAAVTASNHAWVWGHNVRPADPTVRRERGRSAADAPLPVPVQGLPPGVAIVDISCGSHHTSILLEDGSVYSVGVTTDTVEPIVDRAVRVIPPGVVEMPPRQFQAHFDRTTIVGRDGRQVLEVQLWSHEDLRDGAWYEPPWVEDLLNEEDDGGGGSSAAVRMVHRGWLHMVVVTDD